jgi:hypothetical protein
MGLISLISIDPLPPRFDPPVSEEDGMVARVTDVAILDDPDVLCRGDFLLCVLCSRARGASAAWRKRIESFATSLVSNCPTHRWPLSATPAW